jgi:hypothetical protein
VARNNLRLLVARALRAAPTHKPVTESMRTTGIDKEMT